jgi:hypothetical protein
MAGAVGVSVGKVDGRLQASIARTRASMDNKLRDFITILLWVVSIILCRNPTDGNSARGYYKEIPDAVASGISAHCILLILFT